MAPLAALTCFLSLAPQASAQEDEGLVPIPSKLFREKETQSNPIADLTVSAISNVGASMDPKVPDQMLLDAENATITYNQETKTLDYKTAEQPLHLTTDEGFDASAREAQIDLEKKIAALSDSIVIYQQESLTKASKALYEWENKRATVQRVRAKVNGLIVRADSMDYMLEENGRKRMIFHNAYLSTEDVETPGTWIGVGELNVYPGDFGTVSRLSFATPHYDVPIPVLGWFTFSHSLNPKEGYMPELGTRSTWGSYLLNRYGVLLGNRRVKDFQPTADYLLTNRLDYRSRRGLAVGIDFEDIEKARALPNMKGFSSYLALDSDPMINPVSEPRQATRHNRYKISLQTWEDITPSSTVDGRYSAAANINVLSDRYMLRDFFEEENLSNDKPDNTVRVERIRDTSQLMAYVRFAPNNFYITDERGEISYYRPRSSLAGSRIAYETRSSISHIRQHPPLPLRIEYQERINSIQSEEIRHFYTRLLNDETYQRVNSTHEISTSFSVLRFLNITPKAGFGYSGYYGVDGVGADNRLLGYMGCDFDIKFHREFENFRLPSLGMKGLRHIIHPYATLAHTTLSSANALVPTVDSYSGTYNSNSLNPVSLDLMGFEAIDSWSNRSVLRYGINTIAQTHIDGERTTLLSWNSFMDFNLDPPDGENAFSDLYSTFVLRTSDQFSFYESFQTPFIKDGAGYHLFNTGINYQPFSWLDMLIGHRYLRKHPMLYDANNGVARLNVRLNENYTASVRYEWDMELKSVPVQQYSLFKKTGAWFIGATFFLRDNNGKKENGFGLSFTLGETGSSFPVNLF